MGRVGWVDRGWGMGKLVGVGEGDDGEKHMGIDYFVCMWEDEAGGSVGRYRCR